jgi:outer membrane protein OmpA-like peptidoglycan-associated protein
MRHVLLLAALATPSVALAGEPSFVVGANAGVLAFDGLDIPQTSWHVVPRVGFWFTPNYGLELDVGLSAGPTSATDHGYLAIAPSLNFVANPLKNPLTGLKQKDTDGDGLPDTPNPMEGKASPVQPLLSAGLGTMVKQVDGNGVKGADWAHTRIEALVSVGTGFIVPIVGPLEFRTDVRMLVTAAREDDRYGSPFVDFLFTAGLQARIGVAKDLDKDKIPDKSDICPTEPEDMDGFEDSDGCPEADNDADGVPDASDACPNDPEDIDTFEDEDGCPDLDNDADGVPDLEDTCPLEAGGPETQGCPDGDADGIADKDDRCPTAPGEAEFQGCPDTDSDGLPDPDDECPDVAGDAASFGCPDGDGDLVPDYRDACPTKKAQEGIDPLRSDGCPARVYVAKGAIKITETVYFDSGKSTIQRRSYGLLDDVAAVFLKYAEIKSVQVEGHTDSQGNDASNLTLSQGRAQAVVDYLVAKGVSADRLVAKGFGETAPIADNATSAGRAANRRVAFTILDQAVRMEVKDVTDVTSEDEVVAPAEAAPRPAEPEVLPADEPATAPPAGE